MIIGQIVGGTDRSLVIREKKGVNLELGDLVTVEDGGRKYIYMVSVLEYGSLVEDDRLLTSAGSMLEGTNPNVEIPDKDLRLFRKVTLGPLIEVKTESGETRAMTPRSLPLFFSKARAITEEDFSFLKKPKNEIFLGRIRSGSKVLDFNYYLDGDDLLSHHALISAQTGRGKSNLVKVMLWETMKQNRFGMLVFDVHNEYFGAPGGRGLRDHPGAAGSLFYYSKSPPPGQGGRLRINLRTLDFADLDGVIEFTEAQKQALYYFSRRFKSDWIKELMTEDDARDEEYDAKGIKLVTVRAIRKKIGNMFKIECGAAPFCRDEIFDLETMGESTINDMADHMEQGKVVLIDGSSMTDDAGLIIMSAVLREVFRRYEGYRDDGTLKDMPQIGVVLEEAPRVLSEVSGGNIFGRIAREGRKFKIGLLAVTQIVSVIPDDILANIGTKIIMGNEMAQERRKLIESASQDLSNYEQIIAGLEKGESIISSIFSKFPVPLYTPLFEDIARGEGAQKKINQTFF